MGTAQVNTLCDELHTLVTDVAGSDELLAWWEEKRQKEAEKVMGAGI